ncbi:MAG: hypothetical protein HZB25_06940 [Candidatus Eisenbacteria bacterium]|nr:hypothetical protein [Candidatus Eisenbacteria bacterium]
MSTYYEERRASRRRFVRRNLLWIAPLGAVAAIGVFIGVGFLVTWLWRETVGDIFGIKPISFWQAWGLILLAQILFKSNMQRNVPAGSMHPRRSDCEPGPVAGTAGPEPGA